jgi:hypothetical protein
MDLRAPGKDVENMGGIWVLYILIWEIYVIYVENNVIYLSAQITLFLSSSPSSVKSHHGISSSARYVGF